MTNDQNIAASKEDIRQMMEQMGSYYEQTEQRIAAMEESIDAKMEL